MTLFGLLIAILVIVFALWLVKNYMPAPFQTPTLVIVVVLALIFLVFTFWPGAANVRIR